MTEAAAELGFDRARPVEEQIRYEIPWVRDQPREFGEGRRMVDAGVREARALSGPGVISARARARHAETVPCRLTDRERAALGTVLAHEAGRDDGTWATFRQMLYFERGDDHHARLLRHRADLLPRPGTRGGCRASSAPVSWGSFSTCCRATGPEPSGFGRLEEAATPALDRGGPNALSLRSGGERDVAEMAEPEDWVGRQERRADAMDPWAANALAATLELERPPFAPGAALPLFWHWLHFREAAPRSALGVDGHPALGGFMPPVPEPRRMWAGGRLRAAGPLTLGQPAERVSTIASVRRTAGRSGPLSFVTLRHEIASAGRPAFTEEQDIVYRTDPAPGAAPAPTPAPADHTASRLWSCDATVLFRYSALTFNGHRIHYDLGYARDVEGYPGLVVHGPLLATLLLELATEIAGPPAAFAFRARAPVFAGEPFEACAKPADGGLALWIRGEDGRLAMTAEAAPCIGAGPA